MESPVGPWILAELSDVTKTVGFPLECTQRIKYTCFDVSKGLLVFGATSGGLYVFAREPCSFIQLIPNKEGSIVRIKISPNEKSVAFATHRGIVCVYDCGTDVGTYMKLPVLQVSKEHQGNEVTCIVWNEAGDQLYIGDDTGNVSLLHITKSFTKNVFQNLSIILMHLDSRIVQLDIKENLLLVSTFTKCYICDTEKEHYAQVGQKSRDGEFGACFFYQPNEGNDIDGVTANGINSDLNKTNKKFSILSEEEQIKCFDKLGYLKIYCARPGSRLWEVKINGTVICTHQFKQLLDVPVTEIISSNNFEFEDLKEASGDSSTPGPQSVSFTRLFLLKNKYIFSFKKDGLYILDPKRPSVILWNNQYTDVLDCKVIGDFIYIWRTNSVISILAFYTVEKFVLKCFINQKFKLCAKLCALYTDTIIESIPSSKKIHLISGLGDKLQESGETELFNKICKLLEEVDKVKRCIAQTSKSGIVRIENSFIARNACDIDFDTPVDTDTSSKVSSDETDSLLFQLSPDTLQVIKDFGNTVTDKISISTKNLKKTWNNLEDRVKKISMDKTNQEQSKNIDAPKTVEKIEDCRVNDDVDQICSDASIDNNNTTVQSIYRHIKLDEYNQRLFTDIFEIQTVYEKILEVRDYMISIGNSLDYSDYRCGKLLLTYIGNTDDLDKTLEAVIENDDLCSYFLHAFTTINANTVQTSSCECGYPLPNSKTGQVPLFSEILNVFIEKRWMASRSEECYEICQKVPYMWRKVLLLRKNEDLFNLLVVILQMLDEELLYTYLPQFTVQVWEKVIKLLATLKRNECLNCGRTFEMPLRNAAMLSWDSIGALMIKSIGCRNAVKTLRMHSDMIVPDELSLKFYHSCFFTKLFEKYDAAIVPNLVDALYHAYEHEDAVGEMRKHLQDCLHGDVIHTALPLSVASKSSHWGLHVHFDDDFDNMNRSKSSVSIDDDEERESKSPYRIGMDLETTLDHLADICPNKDCHHCSLPLSSRVLVADGGLWVFACGHTFHGVCLIVLKVKLCPMCIRGSSISSPM